MCAVDAIFWESASAYNQTRNLLNERHGLPKSKKFSQPRIGARFNLMLGLIPCDTDSSSYLKSLSRAFSRAPTSASRKMVKHVYGVRLEGTQSLRFRKLNSHQCSHLIAVQLILRAVCLVSLSYRAFLHPCTTDILFALCTLVENAAIGYHYGGKILDAAGLFALSAQPCLREAVCCETAFC